MVEDQFLREKWSDGASQAHGRPPLRPKNHGLRRLIAFLLLAFVYHIWPYYILRDHGKDSFSFDTQLQAWKHDLPTTINETRLRDRLRYLTLIDRVAGSEGSLKTAHWVKDIFRDAGLTNVHIEDIPVYINYPLDGGRQVAVLDESGSRYSWIAKLEEEALYGNDSKVVQTPVFHGYSREGNVTGPLIYANYGSVDDFRTLADMGLNLTGTIVLTRYNGTQSDRSLKVKAASMAGAIGCIIYSDPMEDGFNLGPVWPDGPYRPSDGVQRGSVALSSWVIGDPLTPGWASSNASTSVSKENNPGLVDIPSLPIAWRDAQHLLKAIQGHGDVVPKSWVGAVPGVGDEWWTGNQSSPLVNVMNIQQEEDKQPIYNVFGEIQGRNPKQIMYVGNHRDAWCQGAADPASGTVAMLEVVQLLGELQKTGWQPRRTIRFASWDGEEYNFLGSTEHVEGHLEEIRQNVIAYLNVDVGVVGGTFRASGSPLLTKALRKVLAEVTDPIHNQTLKELWDERDGQYAGLAAGSDYVAFQDIAGISSIDFGFEGPGYPAPYHSCYESFEWMDRFGDPGFVYHKLLAQLWAQLIVDIADERVLPFDARDFAKAVRGYIESLKDYSPAHVDFASMELAAELLVEEATAFHLDVDSACYGCDESCANHRLIQLERDMLDLTDGGGVPGREQYKHIIFGPQAWGGYDEAYFPAVLDAIDLQDWDQAAGQIRKSAGMLTRAARNLRHGSHS